MSSQLLQRLASIRSVLRQLLVLRPLAHRKSSSIGLILFGIYLLVVRALRYRRRDAVEKHFAHLVKNKGEGMTPEEAQRIISPLIHLEMPFLVNLALSFALFKTYGIPTISKILLATGQLSASDNVSRRYADTEILISTWAMCPMNGSFADENSPGLTVHHVGDPRAALALARVNYLHSKYNINNDDYLYTLALFILDASIWIKKWGWREVTPLEKQAIFVFWRDVGIRMGIKNIPETLDDLTEWTESYEAAAMIPARSNALVAQYTAEEILYPVPKILGLKSFARRCVWALLDPRVRIAMQAPAQPWPVHLFIEVVMRSSGLFQKYLCLPRFTPSSAVDPNGIWVGLEESKFKPTRYQPTPWYKPLPSGIFESVRDRLLVSIGMHAKIPSRDLASEGYRIHRQGPVSSEGHGQEYVFQHADEMLRYGCPI
ncbi:hypothetical protein DL96DRAFT_1744338, partial [Flagelloscypha sp. PMI_526]